MSSGKIRKCECLYFLEDTDNKCVKIGVSHNIEARIATLNSSCVERHLVEEKVGKSYYFSILKGVVRIGDSVKLSRKLEKAVHFLFKDANICYEYFDLDKIVETLNKTSIDNLLERMFNVLGLFPCLFELETALMSEVLKSDDKSKVGIGMAARFFQAKIDTDFNTIVLIFVTLLELYKMFIQNNNKSKSISINDKKSLHDFCKKCCSY